MQPSILDLLDGEQRKQDGIALVTANANPDYRSRLIATIHRLASTGRDFTTDDVMEQAGEVPPGYSVNIIGATVNGMATQGVIRDTGSVRKTKRPTGHARRLVVWKGA